MFVCGTQSHGHCDICMQHPATGPREVTVDSSGVVWDPPIDRGVREALAHGLSCRGVPKAPANAYSSQGLRKICQALIVVMVSADGAGSTMRQDEEEVHWAALGGPAGVSPPDNASRLDGSTQVRKLVLSFLMTDWPLTQ
jgi:hypothetical protein